MYLLDSDTLIFILRGHEGVTDRFRQEPRQTLFTSIICISELYYGAYKSSEPRQNASAVLKLRSYLTVLPISFDAASYFGQLKAGLEKRGQRLSDADLWIAATAYMKDMTLVSHNTKHFKRVSDLKLEDWVI